MVCVSGRPYGEEAAETLGGWIDTTVGDGTMVEGTSGTRAIRIAAAAGTTAAEEATTTEEESVKSAAGRMAAVVSASDAERRRARVRKEARERRVCVCVRFCSTTCTPRGALHDNRLSSSLYDTDR